MISKLFETIAVVFAGFMSFVLSQYLPQVSGMLAAAVVFMIFAEIAFPRHGHRGLHVQFPEQLLSRAGGWVLLLFVLASALFLYSLTTSYFALGFISTLVYATVLVLATVVAIDRRQRTEFTTEKT